MSSQRVIDYPRIAQKFHVTVRVVEILAELIQQTRGEEARFDIPELGGKGIWKPKQGAIIGNGFNEALNQRATALCNEIVALQKKEPERDETTYVINDLDETVAMLPIEIQQPALGIWWPEHLGDDPDLIGNAGTMRYAYFAEKNRLVIQHNLRNRIFDMTGHKLITVSAGRAAGFFNTLVTTEERQFTITELREVSK